MGEAKEISSIADLVADAENAREHNPRNVGMIVDALHEVGAARSIVIDEDGNILAGNATIEAAAEAGIENVRVVDVDGETIVAVRRSGLTAEQRKRLSYFDNRTAELASWNVDQILADVEGGVDLEGMFSQQELDELLAGVREEEAPEDPGARVSEADRLQEVWQTAVGQVWELGEHRLAVGDCTDPAVVESVMEGERADAVVTDPPFNVRGDDWDQLGGDKGFVDFTAQWLSMGQGASNVIIAFMADKNVPLLRAAAARVGLPYRRALIWRKPPGSQFAGASLDGFWFDFEIIQVFGEPELPPRRDTQMAVLEHRTVIGQSHGCEKPVGLLEDLVGGYSRVGDVILDSFAGSGTTGIACERLGRRARLIEIDPKYCAVILQRFADMGLSPVIIEDVS